MTPPLFYSSVRVPGAADQRRLLEIVGCENLLQIPDLGKVMICNIGLVGMQRQVILMIGLGREKSL
jgi:hypothetical protein